MCGVWLMVVNSNGNSLEHCDTCACAHKYFPRIWRLDLDNYTANSFEDIALMVSEGALL